MGGVLQSGVRKWLQTCIVYDIIPNPDHSNNDENEKRLQYDLYAYQRRL